MKDEKLFATRLGPEASGLRPAGEKDGKKLYEIPIMLSGEWWRGKRKVSISAEDLRAMAANFRKRRTSVAVIDYEHASEMPWFAQGGPIPAAGWMHALRVTQGFDAKAPAVLRALVEWTELAEDLIRRDEYKFFSPAWSPEASDRDSGEAQGATLSSGALTNHPFLQELPPIVLAGEGADRMARSAGLITFSEEGQACLFQFGEAEQIEVAVIPKEMTVDPKKDDKNVQLTEQEVGLFKQFMSWAEKTFRFGEKPKDPAALETSAAVAQLSADITTLRTELGAERTARTAEAAQHAASGAVQGVKTFIEKLTAEGKWTPAFEKKYGIQRLLSEIAAGKPLAEIKLSFSETKDGKEVKTELGALDALKRFFTELPQIVPLGNMVDAAGKGSNVIKMRFNETRDLKVDPESLVLNTMAESFALELRKADPKLSELDAFKQGMAFARAAATAKLGA